MLVLMSEQVSQIKFSSKIPTKEEMMAKFEEAKKRNQQEYDTVVKKIKREGGGDLKFFPEKDLNK